MVDEQLARGREPEAARPGHRGRELRIDGDRFLLGGRPFQIVSGAMHYWRVLPDHWANRIAWARHLGLNTLETYVPWHLHEPRPGDVRFDGILDVRRYLTMVADAGLHAVVRPGPYICAETDFGGLPPWLLREPGTRVRTEDPAYLRAVEAWFGQLLPRLADLQSPRGGPIIAMQVENELGSDGHRPDYLDRLVALYRAFGIDVPLFTSDNHDGIALGKHRELLATMNFGDDPRRAWKALAEVQPDGPRMCTEYWLGWFDHWGERHHVRDATATAAILDEMLAAGASVNLYLFHGGTNFGFSNGANVTDGRYRPTITSYDYDAPLSEGGRPTAKFDAFRSVIARHVPAVDAPAPAASALLVEQTIRLDRSLRLLEALPRLSAPVPATAPPTMEALGQNYGFVLYRFTAEHAGTFELRVPGIRDRGQVLVNGVEQGVLEREHEVTSISVHIPEPGARVDVLVENQGRVNYGPHLADRKGILGDIEFDHRPVRDLTVHPLPLDNLDVLDFDLLDRAVGQDVTGAGRDRPVLCAGRFDVDEPADGYLDLSGWTKGVVWVNGFNLGRYWDRGPQRRLYLPGPLLRTGRNELRVLELHRCREPSVLLTDSPDLGS